MNRNVLLSLILGVIFFGCGVSWLLANLFGWQINFGVVWPLFLVLPGLFFIFNYATRDRENHEQLFPGVILTALGLTFLVNNLGQALFQNNVLWTLTIFMYPGSVALGFWAVWLATGRQFKHAFVAMILSAISLFLLCLFSLVVIADTLFANTQLGRFVWPLSFICVGSIILFFPILQLANKDKSTSKPAAAKSEPVNTPMQPTPAHAEEAEVVQHDATQNPHEAGQAKSETGAQSGEDFTPAQPINE
jgi:hypothetical protein